MNRQTFLNDFWSAYPVAQPGWISVDEYNASLRNHFEPSLAALVPSEVCGRLQIVDDEFVLSSGGCSVRFIFSTDADWLQPQKLKGVGQEAEFSKDLLQNGDLICVRFRHQEAGANEGQLNQLTVTNVLLLVPSTGSYSPPNDFTIERSNEWADFLACVRDHFKASGFIEALTPTLVPSPGTEPFLDPFSTEWVLGSKNQEFFLPTSPEFHLKKLLVRGWTKVFEFKPCFRNGEISPHHQPEFMMLEWYRAYSSLDSIADDVESLLLGLAKRFSIQVPRLERTTMAALFREKLSGFELRPDTTIEVMLALAKALGVTTSPTDSWDDVFFRIFIDYIEPGLGSSGPLLVRGYPPSQAALSRIGPDGFADRFEVYWKGLELANAFHELNDPIENEKRFRDDALKKAELGKRPVPVDEELIRAFKHGLPPSGGIALGLERLFMALFDISSIEECRAFPVRAIN